MPRYQILLVALLLTPACVGKNPVVDDHRLTAGDTVRIDYTCRTPDGALAAASNPSSITTGEPVSPLFLAYKEPRTMTYSVPGQPGDVMVEDSMAMEEKIERYLLRQSVGKAAGDSLSLTVEGELGGGEGGDRYLSMRRNFWRPRQVVMTPSAFEAAFGAAPVVGMERETKVAGMSIRVLSVGADKVEARYGVVPGTKLPSDFGEMDVAQTEDRLEMRTMVREGALLRTNGSLVGKIIDVTDDTFVVDYGHPFGFATFSCQTSFQLVPPIPVDTQAAVTTHDKSPN